LDYDGLADDEGVAGCSARTAARRYVVDHITNGCLAASARTRVLAPLVQTGFVSGTVRVHRALRAATNYRVSKIVGQAFANAVVALRVGTARGRITRIGGRDWRLLY